MNMNTFLNTIEHTGLNINTQNKYRTHRIPPSEYLHLRMTSILYINAPKRKNTYDYDLQYAIPPAGTRTQNTCDTLLGKL